MTEKEAWSEARRRWGDHFGILVVPLKKGGFKVQDLYDRTGKRVGVGETYEAAFADADSKT